MTLRLRLRDLDLHTELLDGERVGLGLAQPNLLLGRRQGRDFAVMAKAQRVATSRQMNISDHVGDVFERLFRVVGVIERLAVLLTKRLLAVLNEFTDPPRRGFFDLRRPV